MPKLKNCGSKKTSANSRFIKAGACFYVSEVLD